MAYSDSALFFLPQPPGTTSPSFIYTSLTNHIAHKFSTSELSGPLPSYTIDHRLFISTNSLVPSPSTPPRQYLQLLTIPHLNSTETYIGSSNSDPLPAASATITTSILSTQPSTSPSAIALVRVQTGHDGMFTSLLYRKLQPLWLPRSTVRIENGFGMTLHDGVWEVRIGEIVNTDGSAGVGQGQGPQAQTSSGQQTRGVLVEVKYWADWIDDLDMGEDSKNGDDSAPKTANEMESVEPRSSQIDGETVKVDPDPATNPDPTASPKADKTISPASVPDHQQPTRESLLRAFFQALLRDCPGVPVKTETGAALNEDAWRVLVDIPSPSLTDSERHAEQHVETLVKLYMELLRFAR